MAFSCLTCGGFGFSSTSPAHVLASCSNGQVVGMSQQGLGSCAACNARAEETCDYYGHGEGLSVAPKKPRLTSGISPMRSASGGGSCYCSHNPLCMGKLMTNGLCDCKGCKKNEVNTAVNWLTRII